MQTRKQVLSRDRAATLGRTDGSGAYQPRAGRSALMADDCRVLEQDSFQDMIAFERKRSERSGKGYALILVDAIDTVTIDQRENVLEKTGQVRTALNPNPGRTRWCKARSKA